MKFQKIADTEKPTFCWDRNWSIAEIKKRLAQSDENERLSLMAWILREGTFAEIWTILLPSEVYAFLNRLTPFLGRRKEYWRYTFNAWHRLGKV